MIWLVIPQQCVIDGLFTVLKEWQGYGPLALPSQLGNALADAQGCAATQSVDRLPFFSPLDYMNGCAAAVAGPQLQTRMIARPSVAPGSRIPVVPNLTGMIPRYLDLSGWRSTVVLLRLLFKVALWTTAIFGLIRIMQRHITS
jgi:hypothetical protein